MWHLVKAEFKYNWKDFLVLGLFLLFYTIVVLFNYSAIAPVENMWENTFQVFFYVYFYIIFIKQIKVKRAKHFGILPISNKNIAVSRLLFSTIPFVISLIYFLLIQLVNIESKQADVSYTITGLAKMLSLIASFIIVRDTWFFYPNLAERLGASCVSTIIVFGVIIIFFHTIQSIIPIFGMPYDNIQYFLLGLVIMFATIFTYQKRKSYLS